MFKLISISAWKSNHASSKVWDEITYPFPNFNGCTVYVWEWISNCIPQFIMDVITILKNCRCPIWHYFTIFSNAFCGTTCLNFNLIFCKFISGGSNAEIPPLVLVVVIFREPYNQIHYILNNPASSIKRLPWLQGSWGQHGAHLGSTGPRWAPCWPYEPGYLGNSQVLYSQLKFPEALYAIKRYQQKGSWSH